MGVRYVPYTPMRTLAAALPWPDSLGRYGRWSSGSGVEAALRDWLAAHRNRLRWDEAGGRYVLPP